MSLPYMMIRIFHELRIKELLNISEVVFANYIKTLSDLYKPEKEVCYHNQYHAADVLCTHYYFLKSKKFDELSLLDIFASLVAAASHDVCHDGFNNRFHINSQSPLALLYNDRAVLENHHATVGWKLMSKDKHDFLSGLPSTSRRKFRQVFTSCILATDMAEHSYHLIQFKRD
eukprot:UN23686